MKAKGLFRGLLLVLTASVAHATPVLTVGTPADSMLSSPSRPSPSLGGILLSFDTLAPGTTYSTYTSNGVSISSPDGLAVLPFSTQSGPNELFDASPDGSARISIFLTSGASAIGFGIADSDPVSLTIQPIGANGVLLGSPFVQNLLATESFINTGNGYYVVQDATADIFGLLLTQLSRDPINYSGLAIDDVQIASTPEPSTLSLVGMGVGSVVGLASRRRLKQA